jgi:hypothetical protein
VVVLRSSHLLNIWEVGSLNLTLHFLVFVHSIDDITLAIAENKQAQLNWKDKCLQSEEAESKGRI